MNLYQKIFQKKLAFRIAQIGFGPFKKNTLISFLNGVCCNCASEINDWAIFGNAFIIYDNEIKLLCRKCRTKHTNDNGMPEIMRGGVNKRLALIYIYDQIKKLDFEDVNWYQILAALRTNYYYLHDVKHYKNALKIKFEDSEKDYLYKDDFIYMSTEYQKSIQEYYGNIKYLGRCGECGVRLQKTIKEDKKCWCCNIPNYFQWNMRTSFEMEYKINDITINI